MRTMSEFPFVRIHGLEISDYVSTIAIRNFKLLHADRCMVIRGDASHFMAYDAYNIVYSYNPFCSGVMAEVMEGLIQSVSRSDRELVNHL